MRIAVLLLLAVLLPAAPGGAQSLGALDAAVATAETASERTRALVRRGEALRLSGRFRAAFEDLFRAADIAPSAAERSYALAALGAAQAEAGVAGAEATLRLALDGRRAGLAPHEAVAAAHLARLLAGRDDPEARDLARAAVAGAPPGPIAAFARTVEGETAAAAGSPEADEAFRAALAETAALPAGPGRERAALDLAITAMAADGPAPDVAREALALAGEPEAPRLAAAAADARARLAVLAGDQRRALAESTRALALAQRVAADDLTFRIERRRAAIAGALGEEETALAAYRAAFASLQGLRADLALRFDERGQSLYRAAFQDFHTDYISLLVELSETRDTQALLTEAIAVLEDLKVLEIEDYFQERCVRRAREASVDEVDPATLLVYPVILADRLEIIVGRGGRLTRRTSPVPADELGRLVRAALDASSRFDGEHEAPSRALHDALIAPIEDLIAAEGVDTVVYAPDGVLRLFPVAALWDGERFLIERVNVATVLGLTLVDPGRVTAGARSLVAGASRTVVEGFPDIPGILDESERVGRLLGADIRLNEGFPSRAAAQLLRTEPYGIVHIAAHATFGAQPSDNFIALADGPLDLPTLVDALRARAIEQDQPIDLLTLSACQTAQGTDRAPLGLAGAAYRANARSVLASLWLVSDVVTPEIMWDFYRRLLEDGASRAEALAGSQRRFLADYPSFRHPAFWGAFILIGDWQ